MSWEDAYEFGLLMNLEVEDRGFFQGTGETEEYHGNPNQSSRKNNRNSDRYRCANLLGSQSVQPEVLLSMIHFFQS
jgi:hypothetical protein